MATRTPKPPQRKSVSLQVCIDELQLIQSLSEESKKDPRLKELVANAKVDVIDALNKIKGDDTGKNQNPDGN